MAEGRVDRLHVTVLAVIPEQTGDVRIFQSAATLHRDLIRSQTPDSSTPNSPTRRTGRLGAQVCRTL
jgi:hypothetical protein